MRLFFIIYFFASSFCGFSQYVQIIESKDGVSLRGLSVVNNKIIWVSGSKGTVGKSIDGGTTWQWMNVEGYEKKISVTLKPLMHITQLSWLLESRLLS